MDRVAPRWNSVEERVLHSRCFPSYRGKGFTASREATSGEKNWEGAQEGAEKGREVEEEGSVDR